MAELTPMMRQYMEEKEKHPDSLLFFRLGDFYEMFGPDARTASRELDLALTTRDKDKSKSDEERIPMCGVPYHSAEGYIARLIAKGYKVSICEQMEDPALAKGLVKREIIRTVTPGTVLDEVCLDAGRSNYLCGVYLSETAAGLCAADISTGQAQVTAFTGAQRLTGLINELGRFAPAEAVMNAAAYDDPALTAALEQEKASLNALTATRAAIEQLQKQLETGADGDLDKLSAQLKEQNNQKEEQDKQRQSVYTRIKVNEQARDGINKQRGELEELEQKYTWMNALARTAAGNLSGKAKIDLETYVQTTYFDRILERANLRLQKMSGGQYDLKRRRDADSLKSRSGLELDIVDHINATERSVNTLSGGEAFLASLALALGLSDEVQMSTGIHLDTLFVDEGFGSLDSEALSKAYQTLAGLTDGNRLVGIISHVAELKERIDRQIVVTKDPDGSSHAELVI
mgnify:CR=1 FL=1